MLEILLKHTCSIISIQQRKRHPSEIKRYPPKLLVVKEILIEVNGDFFVKKNPKTNDASLNHEE